MRKFFYLFVFFLPSFTFAQATHYDGISDLRSALETMIEFPKSANRNGWNDTYDIKNYYNIIQNADKKIDRAIEKFEETIDLIEKTEKHNYTCLSSSKKQEVNDILYKMGKIKRELKSAIDDLYDLDMSDISSRLFTIYKYPSRKSYKKAAVPEIQSYYKSTFRNLKSIHNHLADLTRNTEYFQLNVNTTSANLLKMCD